MKLAIPLPQTPSKNKLATVGILSDFISTLHLRGTFNETTLSAIKNTTYIFRNMIGSKLNSAGVKNNVLVGHLSRKKIRSQKKWLRIL